MLLLPKDFGNVYILFELNLECEIHSIIILMSLWPVCTFLVLCWALSNFLLEKSLPLDLRCCWINHPIILLGLTPPNLLHDTCRPVAGPNPLYHTSSCPSSFMGRTRWGEIWQMTAWWCHSAVILCSGSWSRTTKMMTIWAEAPLDKIRRCQSETKINSQLSVSAKGKLSLPCTHTVPQYNWGWCVCGDTEKIGQKDIDVDLNRLFREGNAQVHREHRDWVLILSGLGI